MSAKIYYSVKDAAWIITDRASGKVFTINDLGVITPNKTKGSAYTQTYATADKTHIDDGSTAVVAADATITAGTAGFTDAAEATKVVTLVNELKADYNLLRAQVLDLKQLVNSVIDDLQALGLVG